MRIIKLLCLFFLLSSCNKYLGVVKLDYVPKSELDDVFLNNINESKQTEILKIKKIIYPLDNFQIVDISKIELKKLISLEENSAIYFENDSVYFTKNQNLIIHDLNKSKEILKIKLNLDKDEKIIEIFQYSNEKFILTNKSKLFLFMDDEIVLVANFDRFINDEIIIKNEKLLIFSVFGDLYEINLIDYTSIFKGKFSINHGINFSAKNYNYKNQISHLFNSGTLLFLSLDDYNIETNYFLEDLNILSSLGYFEDFIDAPFSYNNYLYFIDRSGLISVFNPLKTEFLWEVNINTPIKDFNFSEDGNLLLLTNNDVFIFDSIGKLIKTLEHSNDNPLKLFSERDKIFIFNEKGIDVLDLKSGTRITFFKNKFEGDIEYINFNSNFFIKDSKELYKLSE
jgi:hypothetical protein